MTKYRVYYSPEGSDSQYCGEFESLDEAQEAAESEPDGLEQCLWDTARAAGHCGGLSAPDAGEEGEPLSWHGTDGWYCVIAVATR
jgi:hypothetical protein